MAKRKPGSAASRLARWRLWVQAAFLLVWLDPVALLGPLFGVRGTFRLHMLCSPVFHCHSCPLATFACPIGILAHLSAGHVVPYMAIGTLTVFGALFGSFICGWACPFGFLQDLIARIPTPKLRLPGWMGISRYVVLLVLVVAIPIQYGTEKNPLRDLKASLTGFAAIGKENPHQPAESGNQPAGEQPKAKEEKPKEEKAEPPQAGEGNPLFFCRLCPVAALEAALPYTASLAIAGEAVVWPSPLKLAILGLLLLAMFFVWRPWCTLFCPLGAIYGLLNRVSLLSLRFHPDRCKDCDLCRDLCHYRGAGERRPSDLRCIRCLKCTQCRAITLDTVFSRPEKAESKSSPAAEVAGP
jgi:ferredoxin-type protein NapH